MSNTRCYTPLLLRDRKHEKAQVVPCGRCPNCRLRRASNWSVRLMQEDKFASSSFFLTLSYDNVHIPISRNGFMSARKRDLQLFFKRLRRSHPSGYTGIKYFAVSEYGGRTWRPHYHIILFNAQLESIFSKVDLNALRLTDFDGKCHVNCLSWPNGHVTVGRVSESSVGYTMKYICKTSRIPLHRNDDRVPEFNLQSKGLGLGYLSDAVRNWHLSSLTDRMYLMLPGGVKVCMPRYYKNKLYTKEQLLEINSSVVVRKSGMSIRDRHESFEAHKRRADLKYNSKL